MSKEEGEKKKGQCQFTPFEVGQIKAHVHHGLSAAAISRLLVKPDGKNYWSERAVGDAITKLEENPTWRGERQKGSGRKRKTSKKLDKLVERQVFKHRGSTKVTVAYLKKIIPALRPLSDGLVESRLHDAGLAWLRRRKKFLVTCKYIQPRIDFAQNVLAMHQSTLKRWAYSDGTVFYLDKDDDSNEHTQRMALGSHVWRMFDGSDALYRDTIGPPFFFLNRNMNKGVLGVKVPRRLAITVPS